MNLAAHIANRQIIKPFTAANQDYYSRQIQLEESFVTVQKYSMERVGFHNKITFYNDSKACNLNATWFSLTKCPSNTIWIVGSMNNFKAYLLREPAMLEQYKKIKALIVLGDSTFWHTLGKEIAVIMHCEKENLVSTIRQLATDGDTVLFSPACASFDRFENFEARGKWFTDQVVLHI